MIAVSWRRSLAGPLAIALVAAAITTGGVAAQGGAPPGKLLAGVDDLPIVVEVPGPLGQEAREAFERATVLHPEPLTELFDASWEALVTTDKPEAIESLEELRERTLVHPEESIERIDPDLAREAMENLVAADEDTNPENLSNAAVALWLMGVTQDLDPETSPTATGYAEYVQQAAVHLLEITNEAFPAHRPVLLNLAFVRGVLPVEPDRDFGGVVYARQVLDLDPTDLTARLLVASLQSRKADDPSGALAAEETLTPLLGDPATAALGHAAIGDAHLAAATLRRPEAPADARRHAGLALKAYDEALAAHGITDADRAGLQAGRALALEALGDLQGAIEAQKQALVSDIGALGLRVGLARLEGLAGDVLSMRGDAKLAFSAVEQGWDPPLAGLRFVPDPYGFAVRGDYGFLGWSVGSQREQLPVKQTPQGGGIVVISPFARTNDPNFDHGLRAMPIPRAAATLALDAAIADGDADGATGWPHAWTSALPWGSAWMGDSIGAASVVATGRLPAAGAGDDQSGAVAALTVAETSLRRAGRFGRAAELCGRVAGASTDPVIQTTAWRCAGESAYLGGDAARATEDLINAYQASLGIGGDPATASPDPVIGLLAGAAGVASGDAVRPERLFRSTIASLPSTEDPRPLAAIQLGDLELARREPVAAAGDYALALAMIDVGHLDVPDKYWDMTPALEMRALKQVAANNRAIALLQSLQRAPDGAPDCAGLEAQAICEEALDDFTAAADSDPGNAVYALNVAWAQRLMGNADGATSALRIAISLDPTLYPAFNDLGVLLARRGDLAGAREAFDSALSASPDYDLARWNLGILALQESPLDLWTSASSLARASRVDRALATAPLDFRLDERTYRFGFDLAPQAPVGETVGRAHSVGAATLAAAVTVGTLAQLQAAAFARAIADASSAAEGWFASLPGRIGWRRRVRGSRQAAGGAAARRGAEAFTSILPWLLTLAVLVVVTAWAAAQANPVVAPAAIVMALVAVALALVAHEAGHIVAARWVGGRLVPDAWGPGAAVAVLFLPFRAAAGPYLAERLRVTDTARHPEWAFHLAGPLANALLAIAAYVAFLAEPAPLFRLIAQVQLAVIAYSLLPIRPLDGWALARSQPRLLVVAGFALFVASTAFALGML